MVERVVALRIGKGGEVRLVSVSFRVAAWPEYVKVYAVPDYVTDQDVADAYTAVNQKIASIMWSTLAAQLEALRRTSGQ